MQIYFLHFLLITLTSFPDRVTGMFVFDTGAVSTHVRSPLFNRNIGRQIFDSVVGPIVYTQNADVCDIETADLTALVRGKIVLLDRGQSEFWDLHVARQQVDCLSVVGALAVVKADHLVSDPGMGARAYTRPTLDPESSVPVVHIVLHEIPESILRRIKAGDGTIRANITIDSNPWEELWESPQLFALWELVLPLANFSGLLLGLTSSFVLLLHHRHAVIQQGQKMSRTKRQLRNSNMRLLIAANLFISGTCFVRLFYCFSGPLFSSTSHTMDFHLSLLDSTVVWEAVTSMIAIVIFRNWASFGMPKGERTLHAALSVLAAVSIPMYLCLSLVYESGLSRDAFVTLVLRPVLLEAISAIVAGTYAYRVVHFVRTSLVSSAAAPASRANRSHRRRIGAFMAIASLANVLSVAAGILAQLPHLSVSVWVRFALYTMMFVGLTLQSVTQAIAFFPSLSIVLDQQQVAKAGTLAQEIRQRRKCAQLNTPCKESVQPTDAGLAWTSTHDMLGGGGGHGAGSETTSLGGAQGLGDEAS